MARRAENVVAFYNKRGTCYKQARHVRTMDQRVFHDQGFSNRSKKPKRKQAACSGIRASLAAAEKFRAAITTCRLAGYPSCFTIVSIVQHRPCPGRWGESDVY
jgi:hypothetical protein